MAYNRRPLTYTASVNFYNSNCSSLELAFMNYSGGIKIASVFDEFKGKKARRGDLMYDHDNAITFALAIEELIQIRKFMNDLLTKKWKDFHLNM